MINEDPERAFSLGPNEYLDGMGSHTSPSMKVKGIVIKEEKGSRKVTYQGNLTNFFGKDGGVLEEDGKFVIVKERKFRLYRLLLENKARIIGYTAFYCPAEMHDNGPVEIIEAFQLA